MAVRIHHAAAVGLPIIVALLFAGWRAKETTEFEASWFDEPGTPALELLQREAKVIHMSSKKPAEQMASLHENIHKSSKKPAKQMASSDPGGFGEALKDAAKLAATTTTTSASEDSSSFGISSNGVGNLPIFISGIITDACVCMVCFFLFWFWCRRYPIMYFGNSRSEKSFHERCPTVKSEQEMLDLGFFNWARASWQLSVDDIWTAAGLDHAMLIEYANIGFNTFKWVALPMFFIQGPMNCFFGGNMAGQDHESWFSMGNVDFFCWLYWPIAFWIWYVTWCVTSAIHKGMADFMPKRFKWLQEKDELVSKTIMMTGIPAEQDGKTMTDESCKQFWNNLQPNSVEAVHLTKDTSQGHEAGNLMSLYTQRQALKDQKQTYEGQWNLSGNQEDARPKLKTGWFGGKQEDAIEYCTAEINKKDKEIADERKKVKDDATKPGVYNPLTGSRTGLCLGTGFVTFKERKDAEIALRLDLSETSTEWILDYPPLPQDILWSDMTQDPRAEAGRHLLGYGLTAGLLIMYMPLVIAICNVAEMINLGPLQSIWSSEAPSLGLTIMVDFLPTILHMIFHHCFSLYDKTMSQYKLSVWYWWMCVLYVVLITALGTNFMQFAETLAKDPLKIFSLLADTMPDCTHYYMNYIGMQAYSHAMVLTRYVSVIKYRKAFHSNGSEEESKALAEPEDQDYYGIGSRTCRWSIMFCIGIVYGTLSPPCGMLTFFLFYIIRLIYGYMFVYAETIKSDLGGIFFVRALHNTFITLHIYMILMVGVFCQRAPNWGPVVLVCVAWGYIFHSQKKFAEYKWERLPYPMLKGGPGVEAKLTKGEHRRVAIKGNYQQPELRDEVAK